ncbi:MAG: hypothetical protein HC905_17420 [Bacteroidales bacterium]|nr:hypothetical protein [Bacteroidales bacterium]
MTWVVISGLLILFFQCQNPNELLKVITVLMIVNKQYQICDKLLIYIGSDYGQDLTGLINPRNCKVFLYGISNDKNQSATIYKVNPDNLKFEKQQEDHNLNGNIDDLNATIEMLGWESYFK